MRTRAHYEKLFAVYPDVVTLPEFQAMLGGIGDSTARKIMRANKVQTLLYQMYIPYTQSLRDRLCNELRLLRVQQKVKSKDLSGEPFVKANGSFLYSSK